MKALIFDTETIDAYNRLDCFDIGWVIRDLKNNKIIKKRAYYPEEVLKNKKLFKLAYFYDKNYKFYETRVSTPFDEVRRKLNKDFIKYSPDIFSAYMIGFDTRVLNFNFLKYTSIGTKINMDKLGLRTSVIDLPLLFGVVELKHSEAYKNYCADNNLLTKTLKSKTTVEAVYSYIKGEHIEEHHTGLQDAIMESEILQYCYDNSEDIEKDIKEAVNLTKQRKRIWFLKEMKL